MQSRLVIICLLLRLLLLLRNIINIHLLLLLLLLLLLFFLSEFRCPFFSFGFFGHFFLDLFGDWLFLFFFANLAYMFICAIFAKGIYIFIVILLFTVLVGPFLTYLTHNPIFAILPIIIPFKIYGLAIAAKILIFIPFTTI